MAPAQPRRVISQRQLISSYPTGNTRISNPAYRAAADGPKAAKSGGSIHNTGDPTLDIIGTLADLVLLGYDSFTARGDTATAEQGNEPKYVEEPQQAQYSYDLAEHRGHAVGPDSGDID